MKLASIHLVTLVTISECGRSRPNEDAKEDLGKHEDLRNDELPELDGSN
jgi:hypothetical protein